MNNTGAAVGFSVVAAATAGTWLIQKWWNGRKAQSEYERLAQAALRNLVRIGPDDVVQVRYSPLHSLSELQIDLLEQIDTLDASFNQLVDVNIGNNAKLKTITSLELSGNIKLNSLAGIEALQPVLRSLVAVRCNIHDISSLKDFQKLGVLNLAFNIVKSIPSGLIGLKLLDLRMNLIDALPDSICDSVELKYLDLQGLQLKALPENFGRLTNLEKLSLRANKLTHCSQLSNFTKLRFLDLTKPGNGISFRLCDLGTLNNVVDLRLAGIRLVEFPVWTLKLKMLETLDLVQNAIAAVPSKELLLTSNDGKPVSWKKVNLAFNSLTEFPVDLLYIPHLEHLSVRNNGFTLNEQIELLDSHEALALWRSQYQVELSNNQNNNNNYINSHENNINNNNESTVSEGSPFNPSFESVPTVSQAEIQDSIWTDIFNFRSTKKPAFPVPKEILDTVGREVIIDRILGCIYGNAIGDAIGLTTEFMTKDQANFYYQAGNSRLASSESSLVDSNDSHLTPEIEGLSSHNIVPDAHRSHYQEGDWTDDTDQCILIMDNLIQHKGQPNIVLYGKALKHWLNNGFPELGDSAGCGCGRHTFNVISHPLFATNPHAAAADVWEKSDKKSAPNGAVMRTSILGCAQFWNRQKVVQDTTQFALSTHTDPRCVSSAVIVASAISSLISSDPTTTYEQRIDKALEESLLLGLEVMKDSPAEQIAELQQYFNAEDLKSLDLSRNKEIGYTFKALGAGVWSLRQVPSASFEGIITRVILEAGDADTNAAVAGAMLGAAIGFRALPAKWISELVHPMWLNQKIKQFLELYGLATEVVSAPAPSSSTSSWFPKINLFSRQTQK